MIYPNNYMTASGWIRASMVGRQNFYFYNANNNLAGFTQFPQTSGAPYGYYPPAWLIFPIKSGGLSTALAGEGDMSASALLIRFAEAALTGEGTLSATGVLIVAIVASISGSGDITDADIKAFLDAVATLTGSGDINADMVGFGELISALTASGTIASTLTGVGELSADILSYGTLTPEGLRDAVWNAVAASYDNAGTMGEKLNDAGSGSNPWTEVIESGFTAAEVLRILAAVAAGKTTVSGNNVKFRNLGDTKDRVDADMTGSSRTNITIDAT